jgi:hypothetical protein
MAITVPNTFAAGTTILSSAMNANFDELEAKALDKTGDTITGNISASAGVTFDGRDISADLDQAVKTTSSPTFAALTVTAGVTAADLTATDDLVVGDDASITGDLTVGGAFSIGSLTVTTLTAANYLLLTKVFDQTYNDGSGHAIPSMNDVWGIVRIATANQVSFIPFFANGGSGVGYKWSYLDPDSGWVTNSATTFSFSDAGGINTYSVAFGGGDGTITVTRTAGATQYTLRAYTF